jgi:protein-tyrosine phosphatase
LIDFHCHILAATDDGPADNAGALAIAAVLARVGFTRVHCTPHLLRGAYDHPADEIRARVSRLGMLVEEKALRLHLAPGAEYYFDEYLPEFLADPLPLAGTHILVEAPHQASWPVVSALADHILAKGLTPLIAHPERTPLFNPVENGRRGLLSALPALFRQTDATAVPTVAPALASLREKGCRFQGNLGSFAGIYGERVRQHALTLLDQGIYSCLGSDAHRPDGLEKTLLKGIATVQGRIGTETAAKLLAGELLAR